MLDSADSATQLTYWMACCLPSGAQPHAELSLCSLSGCRLGRSLEPVAVLPHRYCQPNNRQRRWPWEAGLRSRYMAYGHFCGGPFIYCCDRSLPTALVVFLQRQRHR